MRARQDLVDLFSAFVQFEGDRASGWLQDGRLRRSMQHQLAQSSLALPDPTRMPEVVWSLYWYRSWVQAEGPQLSLALGHLSAYLQEPCYWAAARTMRKLTNLQYCLSDCFQLAIADVETVLIRFDPDRGANLKTFANLAFSGLLKDQLRQRQAADLCTNWGLLRKVSKKRFVEALQHAGLAPAAIAQYRLAWVCFNALYVPAQTGMKPLPKVDPDLWQAIATLYNTERQQHPASTPDCTSEQIERWLNQCAQWVRVYSYPPVDSLNVPRPGLETGGEIQDTLANPLQESLLADLLLQEAAQRRQVQQTHLRAAIVTALSQLDAQSQTILQLYYQQGLTQQQMMHHLQLSQSTVSRRLTKARERLLLAIVQWGQNTMNSSSTSTLITDMSAALEEWLEVHYRAPQSDASNEMADKESVS